jgi:hypothetical protein
MANLRNYFIVVVFVFTSLYLSGAKSAGTEKSSLIIGACIHRISDVSWQKKMLPILRADGITSLRTDVHWSDVEKKKGVYEIPHEWDEFVETAKELKIEPVFIVDYGNVLYDSGGKPISSEAVSAYTNFARIIVQHFGSKVKYFEIWNEWDNAIGNTKAGSVGDYATLVKSAYPAMKAASRDSVILVGGATEHGIENLWYEQLAKLDALKYADGISVHPYTYQVDSESGPELYAKWLDDLHQRLLQKYSVDLPIYVTEIGWPTHQGKNGYPANAVGGFFERVMLLSAARPYIKGVWWYEVTDDGPNLLNREDNFGLFLFNSFGEKPVLQSVRLTANFLNQNSIKKEEGSDDSGIIHLKAVNEKGVGGDVFWLSDGAARKTIECSGLTEKNQDFRKLGVDASPSQFMNQLQRCR